MAILLIDHVGKNMHLPPSIDFSGGTATDFCDGGHAPRILRQEEPPRFRVTVSIRFKGDGKALII